MEVLLFYLYTWVNNTFSAVLSHVSKWVGCQKGKTIRGAITSVISDQIVNLVASFTFTLHGNNLFNILTIAGLDLFTDDFTWTASERMLDWVLKLYETNLFPL